MCIRLSPADAGHVMIWRSSFRAASGREGIPLEKSNKIVPAPNSLDSPDRNRMWMSRDRSGKSFEQVKKERTR